MCPWVVAFSGVSAVDRATRLYEQERVGRIPPGALGTYVRRWVRWTGAGLQSRFPCSDRPRGKGNEVRLLGAAQAALASNDGG